MPAFSNDASWASKPAHKRDFEWAKNPEPHKPRNKLILKEFPEIKKLMGHDPNTKYKIVVAVAMQVCLCHASCLCCASAIRDRTGFYTQQNLHAQTQYAGILSVPDAPSSVAYLLSNGLVHRWHSKPCPDPGHARGVPSSRLQVIHAQPSARNFHQLPSWRPGLCVSLPRCPSPLHKVVSALVNCGLGARRLEYRWRVSLRAAHMRCP